jgi:hypothetical protein
MEEREGINLLSSRLAPRRVSGVRYCMVRWKYTSHLGSPIAKHECANIMLTSAFFVVHPGLRDSKASSLRGAVKVALLTKGKAPALVAMKRSSIEKDSEMVGNVSSES